MQTSTADTKAMTDLQLVEHICANYIKPGTQLTDWKRAFEEHPEWSPRMKYNAKDDDHHKGRNLRQKLLGRGPFRVNKSTTSSRGKAINQDSMDVLNFMKEHGDKNGRLNFRKLDKTMPGWDGQFRSRTWVRMTSSNFIKRGTFAKIKAGVIPPVRAKNLSRSLMVPAQPRKAETNGHTPFEQDLDAATLMLADKMAQERLSKILADNGYCSRCGKSLQEQFMASSFKQRHPLKHG